ncbi:regulatory protein RecX [Pseudochryseolinea flava]|uniref:Regulatory protein RecX n=1 Tax=Pseudochryseolinea flava TaxID=2059302 RepID=A0A364YA63_9BACT|nr:regulatory protein RecX [Pseudochryseolinea flava]RAW03062.1 RecX family transcriptional regulator [Pseudochryseolinea flava]
MKKRLTVSESRQKIYRFCAYQERSHSEVRDKLYEYGLYRDEVDEILSHLITEGFLNEERFAKAFAGGKFRLMKWGRIKIVHALEARGLTPNCIKSGMKEIEDDAYLQTLTEILQKKSQQTGDKDPFVRRDKVARFAIQKGFEPDLVWRVIKSSNNI